MSGESECAGRRWRLLLSAGGTAGVYWMCGALQALAEGGLDPASAELIVGTSAGSLVGAVLATGHEPWALARDGFPRAEVVGRGGADVGQAPFRQARLRRVLPSFGVPMSAALGSLMPPGHRSTSGTVAMIQGLQRSGRPLHPGLRVVAVHRASARRVVFGPDPELLPLAVAASCAVPGWFIPVEIAGDHYIDGGVHSIFNLDLASGGEPAVVVVLSPLGGSLPVTLLAPGWIGMRLFRADVRRRLWREARRARRAGTEIAILEPGPQESQAMGINLMEGSLGKSIYRAGLSATRKRLEEPAWRRLLGRIGAPK